jgi:hypothetical protein
LNRIYGQVDSDIVACMATGETFSGAGAGFTVMETVSTSVAPLLSVTISWNKYTPCIRFVTWVDEAFGLPMLNNGGPLTFDQEYEEMVPSASADAVPFNVTELVGHVML